MTKKMVSKSQIPLWESFELQQLLQRLSTQEGINIESLFSYCELTQDDLAASNSRVSVEQELALYTQIVAHNRDPFLAFDHGKTTSVVQCGVLGQAMQCCATLRAALEFLVAYSKLYSAQIKLELSPSLGHKQAAYELKMQATPVDQATRAFELESTFAAFKRIFHEILLSPIDLLEVSLNHSIEPKLLLELERYFTCPVVTATGKNSLVFPSVLLDQVLPYGDAEALVVIQTLCDKELHRLEQNSSFLWQLKNYISSCKQSPSLQSCAQHFCVSTRTLRRKLEGYDTNYQVIVDQHRSAQAQQMLLSSDCSLEAIALELGFSEPRSFRAAFKRWTGTTPQQFRTGHI